VYSVCVWIPFFVVLGLAAHLLTHPLELIDKHRSVISFLRRFLVYVVPVAAAITGWAAWNAYSGIPPNLPDSFKMDAVRRSLVGALASSTLLAGGLSALVSFIGPVRNRVNRLPHPLFVTLTIVCVMYLMLANVLSLADLQGEPTRRVRPDQQDPTVILVVDAGSWNILHGLVRRGELPAFASLMESGIYGYLQTHGRQYTPPSWTTIATGMREDKHGVHRFDSLASEWRVAPIWSIMSALGMNVAVTNWICTWPPFEVQGGFVSDVISHRDGLVNFSSEFEEYSQVAEETVAPWLVEEPDSEASILSYAREEASRLERIDALAVSQMSTDLIAYGFYATDKAQHFFWRDMHPDLFRDGDWKGVKPRPEYQETIRDVWLLVDKFLSNLMAQYGQDASYFVISDHGSRPIEHRAVRFDTDGLLEKMGFLKRRGGDVDRENSDCFTSSWGGQLYVYTLEVRSARAGASHEIDLAEYESTRSRIIEELAALRVVGTNDPIFSHVEPIEGALSEDIPDIKATASKVLTRMADPDSRIIINGSETPLRSFMEFHPWSGRHRPRGIVLAKGPSLKSRYTGAWTIDDPYARVLRYGFGRFRHLDVVFRMLRPLHLVDEISTLDIAPTILYLSGLPLAEDMDGQVMIELFDDEFVEANPMVTVPTYSKGSTSIRKQDEEDMEKTLKKLEALGYI